MERREFFNKALPGIVFAGIVALDAGRASAKGDLELQERVDRLELALVEFGQIADQESSNVLARDVQLFDRINDLHEHLGLGLINPDGSPQIPDLVGGEESA